jgi:aspartate-semialdehyde dehydrogenase
MKVGLVGWRGMVGSVLMQRMVEENDFAHIEPFYFSTSNAGGEAPAFGGKTAPALMDASDINSLKQMDVILPAKVATIPLKFSRSSKLKTGWLLD